MNLIWIPIGAGLVIGTVSLLTMSKTSSQLETTAQGRIHKITLTGVTVRIDVRIKNPTNGKLKLRFPFIKLSHNGNTIGSSQSIPDVIVLEKHSEGVAKDISIEIPFTSILFTAAGLIKDLKAGKQVKVDVTTKSAALVALGKEIPYNKTEAIILKQAV